MDQLIDSFFDFLVNNSTTFLSLGGIFSPILFKLLVSKSFRVFAKAGTKRLLKALFKNPALTHRIFANVERYNNMTKRITFINDVRKTKLFHILLETKLKTVNDKIVKWIADNPKLLYSNRRMELRNSLESLTIDMIETYEPAIQENYFKYLENRTDAEYYFNLAYHGVCKEDCKSYIKDKIRCELSCVETIGFNEYHSSNISFVNRFIETIPECEGETNMQIFSYYLNYIDNALYSAVYDAKKVFTSQNGRYKLIK